jgi:hypothetical protein
MRTEGAGISGNLGNMCVAGSGHGSDLFSAFYPIASLVLPVFCFIRAQNW